MKRSEMLEHIKDDLLEKLSHRYLQQGQLEKWASLTANELLDMLEGFGMLPPAVDIEVFGKKDNAWEKE